MELNFVAEFKNKLGIPYSIPALTLYLELVSSSKLCEESIYTELHHILPQSIFSEYINTTENLVRLTYENHVEAHKLLATAYPIRKFLRPLNFMLTRKEKDDMNYNNLLSEQVKLWWKTFKMQPEYKDWISARKNAASQHMLSGHSKSMSNKRYSALDARKKVSEHFKDLWKDPQYREHLIGSMKAEKETPEAKKRMIAAAKKRWDSLNEEKRRIFIDTMKSINSDESKRSDASQKITNLWKTTTFRNKMKKRKSRGHDGSKMKEKWADQIWREKMLNARKGKKNEAI